MKVLFILLLLSVPTFAQKLLEPVRVAVFQEETPDEQRLNKLIRAELNKRRDVIVTEKWPRFEVYVAAMATTTDGPCAGFVAASLVVDKTTGGRKLTVHTSGKLEGLAKEIATYLDREYFNRRHK